MNTHPDKKNSIHKTLQLVCFRLGKEEFGVDILKVQEIMRMQKIAHMPQTSESVAGVINLRGNVIPVIDLRKKFGLDKITEDDKMRIIVFNIDDKMVGMIVDRVDRVIRLKPSDIDPPPDIGAEKIQEFVTGIGREDDTLVIILNIDKVLTEEEMLQLDDVEKIRNAVHNKTAKIRTAKRKDQT